VNEPGGIPLLPTEPPDQRSFGTEEPFYRAIHWGAGEGLLECQLCGALVLPDPNTDMHREWHEDNGDKGGRCDQRGCQRQGRSWVEGRWLCPTHSDGADDA
jgi:hypothetical protein